MRSSALEAISGFLQATVIAFGVVVLMKEDEKKCYSGTRRCFVRSGKHAVSQ